MADSTADDFSSVFEDLDGDLPDAVDEAAIERMRAVARILDEGFRLPGTNFRFGLDPVVGVLPGAGDTVAAGVSLYIVVESARMGVSRRTLARMLANIAVDTVGGSIPVLGVIFDAFWKANKWNVGLAIRDLGSGRSTQDADPMTVDVKGTE